LLRAVFALFGESLHFASPQKKFAYTVPSAFEIERDVGDPDREPPAKRQTADAAPRIKWKIMETTANISKM
jgi:hypothetical protein